jgi:hypothetical protein
MAGRAEMMKLLIHQVFGLILLLSPIMGYGQFSAAGSLSTMYDDNLDNNSLQAADKIGLLSLEVGYEWEGEQDDLELSYSGALNYFTTAVVRTSHHHSAGLAYKRSIDDAGATTLKLGASYGLRFDREEYSFYDHRQFSAFTSLTHAFSEQFRGQVSYSFRSLGFSELSEFNYTEHLGTLRLTTFLPTKTTVIVGGDIGGKVYATTNTTELPVGQMRGNGRRRTDASAPGVTQIIGLARIGQSVFEGTGLSVAMQYQANIEKESRYLSSDYGVVSDDELFDDHYAYEGLGTSFMLTQILSQDWTLRLALGQQNRDYAGRPAYDVAGNRVSSLRSDTRRALALQVEHEFPMLGLSVALSFDHIRNDSNDMFYQYTNNALTMMLSVPF